MSTLFDPTVPNRELQFCHPLIQAAWPGLHQALATQLGCAVLLNEGYRADQRQRWLYAQGRTPEQCAARGIPTGWARSGPIVTNAWSARTSAHGHVLPATADWPDGVPASAAIDLLVLGADGKAWTADDPWDQFVALTVDNAPLVQQYGLKHFHRPGVAVWDKPHLQLVGWDDATETLRA